MAACTVEGGHSWGWGQLRRQCPGVGSQHGAPGQATRVSGVTLCSEAGPGSRPREGKLQRQVPSLCGLCACMHFPLWWSVLESEGACYTCAGVLVCCSIFRSAVLFKLFSGVYGASGEGQRTTVHWRRLLARGVPAETEAPCKVGQVSHPLARYRETGKVGVLVPRCRETDGCHLGSGLWCQERAWPWLEKAAQGW